MVCVEETKGNYGFIRLWVTSGFYCKYCHMSFHDFVGESRDALKKVLYRMSEIKHSFHSQYECLV